MGKSAVLYRGTFCEPDFMNEIARILRQNGYTTIKNVCWTRSKNPVDYSDIRHYNIQKGSYDLVAGHSAGGFPTPLTKINARGKRIAFNPFISQYLFVDVVFHAKDDWLVPPDLAKFDKVILYPGKHDTVPKFQFKDWLDTL